MIMEFISTNATTVIIIPCVLFVISLLYLLLYSNYRQRQQQQQPSSNYTPQVFGFFHPYCSGGGGGERVLWKLIQVLQAHGKDIVIYTIDPPETEESKLRQDAERRFDVQITQPVRLISLEEYKHFLLPSPYLSLVLESVGTMKLAKQALKRFQPDVFCDTTGCAFTFLVARFMLQSKAKILAYVHYPTISTDMMLWEWKSKKKRLPKTIVKLIYYWIFAIAYGIVGSLADLVMVNSTWTYNHIASLWKLSRQIYIVYPPCRVPSTIEEEQQQQQQPPHEQILINSTTRANTVVSIGQFRPEKNHSLQVKAFAKLLKDHPEHSSTNNVKLLMIGSCRNDDDRQRVDALKKLVQELQLEETVQFNINPPYSELQKAMQTASIGIHTMRQEHFGIGIVEMMAAGLLTIAHNSGGPKSDIVQPEISGFLACTEDEYATAMHQALTLEDPQTMRQKAQESATRFSDSMFDKSLETVLSRAKMIIPSSTDKKNKA